MHSQYLHLCKIHYQHPHHHRDVLLPLIRECEWNDFVADNALQTNAKVYSSVFALSTIPFKNLS